ncbi:hypothetical protein ACEUCS_12700 [Aeromonas caviae]|uniref:hypothetical protein n=1 Tax=Aeromonas TaxID=642 RepID=UPI00207C440A|nr:MULTISPECIES: hypothetical protein [Aeromonas]MCO4203591.1 hypothetical protein [Aeromonas taiwanensis]MDH0350407.1 hypothetical protein [Aeromonas caviae]
MDEKMLDQKGIEEHVTSDSIVMRQGFLLPNRVHDVGSLVVHTKQFTPTPSIDDLWMTYLTVRIPEERTNDEIDALRSWFYQEAEYWGYEALFL